MNVAELKKYFEESGDFSEQIVEIFDRGNRLRSWKIGSANGFKFRKRRHHLLKPFSKSGDANSQIIFREDCEQFERVAAV